MYRTSAWLFEVLIKIFKPQHNQTIQSLQFYKLTWEQNEKAEEWMGYLRCEVNEYVYRQRDRKLKEQFLSGIIYEEIMTEIIRELTAIKETNKVTCEQVLC